MKGASSGSGGKHGRSEKARKNLFSGAQSTTTQTSKTMLRLHGRTDSQLDVNIYMHKSLIVL